MANQQFQILQQAIGQMFGGSDKEDTSAVPTNATQALSMFKSLKL